MLPTFLLIGSMRSGSTSLMRYLGAHPHVYVPAVKEVHYFDRHHERGTAWYEAHFDQAGAALAVGEGTPAYLYDEAAITRIRATLPEAQLVVIIRNPVDRAYSHYWHVRARGQTTLDFLDELEIDNTAGARARHYVDRGRYLRYLRPLEAERDAGRLLVLSFEELRDEPEPTYRTVCRHVRVDPDPVPAIVGQPINGFSEFRSLHVQRFAKRLPKPAANTFGRLNRKRGTYPPLDPAVRRELSSVFESENTALTRWLGRTEMLWDR